MSHFLFWPMEQLGQARLSAAVASGVVQRGVYGVNRLDEWSPHSSPAGPFCTFLLGDGSVEHAIPQNRTFSDHSRLACCRLAAWR